MKTIKLITLLFGFYAITLAAQQLPSHVEFKELGLSFDIPSGWQGQLTEEAVLLGHNSIPGLMTLTETDKFTNQHKVEANKLATSVKFFKSVDSATTTNWKQKISGSQLKDMHTSGSNDYDGGYTGVSDKVYIELCTNASFYYYSSSQGSYEGSGGFGSAGNSNNNAGTYKISAHADQPYLTLNFANGEIYEYALSSNEQGNTFLDGSRYFVTDLESCY
ncbi:MAG: hypothetical protein L3J52_05905 [Proteobacteria bacterium]|nr:hypothetical protein [Pseudomonadota bacterium]